MCNTVVFGAPVDSDTIPADLLCGADGRGEASLYLFGISGVLETLSADGTGWRPSVSAEALKSPLTSSEPSKEKAAD